MALIRIRRDQFTKVLSALNDPDTVYVIPSFQRPYAWIEKQIDDLFRDMEKASRTNGHHYLAALHLIPLKPNEANDPLTDFVEYSKNKDLVILQGAAKNNELQTPAGNSVQVYAVVDGQQRLTTLFLLAHVYYASKKNPPLRSNLYVTLQDGRQISRLIQNPAADHAFMMSLVSDIWAPGPVLPTSCQSQERMLENLRKMKDWAIQNPPALAFLAKDNFKISAIELEAGYGLTSFMTLNDRGKPLTVLEKLKSLLLQFAYDASQQNPAASSLIPRLHTVFGELYKVSDACQHTELFSKENGDDEMVRLLSCYLRLNKHGDAIWQGAEAAYDKFFRDGLLGATLAAVPSTIGNWCDGIDEVRQQLEHLNGYLNGSLGGNSPSLHFPSSASLSEDYRVTVLSLQLQPHLLALLLKFRVLCGKYEKEWHDRFPIQASAFSLKPVHDLLDDVRQRAGGAAASQPLQDYLNGLSRCETQPEAEISMMKVVERMQMLDWNLGARRLQTFVDFCVSTFAYSSPGDFIAKWTAWRFPDDFIHNVLYGYNETNFRFLLKEYERKRGRKLHFNVLPNIAADGIELEHVFAQKIDSDSNFVGFPVFGIADRTQFDKEVLLRSGNLTWLSKEANAYLAEKTPDIKGAHYCACPGHQTRKGTTVCSNIAITKKLGDELTALGSAYPAMRFYIEARSAELALFAVRRFC